MEALDHHLRSASSAVSRCLSNSGDEAMIMIRYDRISYGNSSEILSKLPENAAGCETIGFGVPNAGLGVSSGFGMMSGFGVLDATLSCGHLLIQKPAPMFTFCTSALKESRRGRAAGTWQGPCQLRKLWEAPRLLAHRLCGSTAAASTCHQTKAKQSHGSCNS